MKQGGKDYMSPKNDVAHSINDAEIRDRIFPSLYTLLLPMAHKAILNSPSLSLHDI